MKKIKRNWFLTSLVSVVMLFTIFLFVGCTTDNKKGPVYTAPPQLSSVYGQKLADIELPDRFSWQDNTSTSVGNAGKNIFYVQFTPANTKDYRIIKNIPVVIVVNKANPTYAVPQGLVATYGDTLADVELPEGFAFSDAPTTSVGNIGNNTFNVVFTPADTNNYNIIESIEVSIAVSKATPAYSIPQGLRATYGDTLADIELPEGFAFVDDPSTSVGNAGTKSFVLTYTPQDANNNNTIENIEVEVFVDKATPTYTMPENLTATYGDTLSDLSLPEGFTFNDATSTSVGSAGKNSFKITFTPADTENYKTLNNISIFVDVEKADPVINISGNLSKTYDGNPVNMPTVISSGGGKHTLVWETQYDNGYMEINYVPSFANTFRVKAIVEETENYNAGESDYFNFTISKANIPTENIKMFFSYNGNDWQELTNDTKIYVGKEIRLRLTNTDLNSNDQTVYFMSKSGLNEDFSYLSNPLFYANTLIENGVYFGAHILAGSNYNEVFIQNEQFHIEIIKGIQEITINMADSIKYKEETAAITLSDIGRHGYVNAEDVTIEYKLASENDSAYTTTVPTEVGSYVIRVTIGEIANYLSGTATHEFRITDIEISNTDSLSKTYDQNPVIAPTITYYAGSEYLEDQVPSQIVYYLASDLTKPLACAPVDAGDYLVVASSSESQVASAFFTISKATPEYEIPDMFQEYHHPDFPTIFYGDTLSDAMPNYSCSYEHHEGNDLIYSGKFIWQKPADEPVYTDGWKLYELVFVPDPEYINNYEIVKYIPVTLIINKRTPVAPTGIEVEYGVSLMYQNVLPSGWEWMFSSTAFYELGEADVYLRFVADDPQYNKANSIEGKVTVVKAHRDTELNIDNACFDNETKSYYLGYGIPVNVSVYQDGQNVTNISILEYKLKGADDSTYTTTKPSAIGEYVVRATTVEGEFYLLTVKEFSLIITTGILFDYYVDCDEQTIYIFNSIAEDGVYVCYAYDFESEFNYTLAEIEELLNENDPITIYTWDYDEGKIYIQDIETGLYLKSLENKNGQYKNIDYGTMLYATNIEYYGENLTLSFNVKGDEYIFIAYAGTFSASQLAGKTQNELAKQNILIRFVKDWSYHNENIIYVKSLRSYFEIQDDGSLKKATATIQYVAYETYGPFVDSYVFVEYLGENRLYFAGVAIDPNNEFNPDDYYFGDDYWIYDAEQNTITIIDICTYHILEMNGKIITIEEEPISPK